MPETPEIETDKLDEKIHEELERAGGSLLKAIALSTALFAALAAVAALRAGSTVNEALVLKTEATRLQAEASDNWAAYQAKGINPRSSRHRSRHGSRLANSRHRHSPTSASATPASRLQSSGSPVKRKLSAIRSQPRPTI